MKTTIRFVLILIIIFALFLIYKKYANNKEENTIRQASFQVAEQYMRNGDYDKAFKEIDAYYKYCLASDYGASLGVRGSFALKSLQKIIENYPEGRKKLDQECVDLESAIKNGNINRYKFDEQYLQSKNPQRKEEIDKEIKIGMLFETLVFFNKARKMEQQTISIFEKLENANSAVAQKEWNMMKEIVFREKRYDIASHYIKDLDKTYRQLMVNRSKMIKENPIFQKDKTFMVQSIKDLLDFGLATNQKTTVKKLVKDLLKQDDINPDHFKQYMNLTTKKQNDAE